MKSRFGSDAPTILEQYECYNSNRDHDGDRVERSSPINMGKLATTTTTNVSDVNNQLLLRAGEFRAKPTIPYE